MSSSSSSSLMISHGVALATAVAVSGTMIVLALCRQKPPFSIPATAAAAALDDPNPAASWCRPHPRSCISNSAEKKLQNRKKKKRVQFAAEVVEFAASGCNEEAVAQTGEERPAAEEELRRRRTTSRRMPANRVALYNGILRDRVMQRTTYSY